MELFIGLLLLLCPFLLTLSLAASPCNETCGNKSIPYPFGIHTDCGLPDYRISCKENSSFGAGPLPILTTKTGEFQVFDFFPNYLNINSTSLTAMSCNTSSPANSTLQLPDAGPYVLSSDNYFLVVGCWSTGNFNTNQIDSNGDPYGVGSCTSTCYDSDGSLSPCSKFPCCYVSIPGGARSISIQGAGATSPGYNNCGLSTVLTQGPQYNISSPDSFITISWGLLLEDSSQNCSTVNSTAAYACANYAECQDISEIPGYVCSCSDGYQGDGYRDGTGCTIPHSNECSDASYNCVAPAQGGHCTDVTGGVTCSCSSGYEGDGYLSIFNATASGCTDINECAHEHSNNCVPTLQGGRCINTAGSYYCGCLPGYQGDGLQQGIGCHQSNSNNAIPAITGLSLSLQWIQTTMLSGRMCAQLLPHA